ncbi:hypothetical protein AOQ84DRAFT_335887 [Glonium stellatum]|uniref:Uncharacterized protein n=1 Tax=Glonium stellatum TaxID=574774 RepID=A0A8E2F6R6_9PEZI|nr:hypothetical protein AOQ84DRAFT_335887 [Glonium stellatum]
MNEATFIVGSESEQDRPTTAKKRRKDTRDYRPDPPLVHTRGISEFRIKGAKETRLIYTFGPSKEDIAPILKTRDKWQPDPTLPSLNADAYGVGGMAPSFYCAKETVEREICKSRKWYYEQGARDAFTNQQKITSLAAEDAVSYMPKPASDHHSFLIGPYDSQDLYTLKTGERLSLDEPWTDPSNQNDSHRLDKLQRRGWMLNLGSKIQNLEWLPNETGTMQYLSISVLQKNIGGRSYKPFQNPKAPSFTPQRPFPASIQIWGFKSSEDGRLDPETSPNLELVICTDWGSVKQFKWCPVGMIDTVKENDHGMIHMGLLAGVWGDGKVRVLDIKYPKPTTSSPFYLNIKQVAFECLPPNTVCTCLTWLSATTIAVGTANGNVAVWTLTPQLLSNTTPNPRPWLYHTLNASYIVNVTSAYPSRPHFLATSSADGFVRLTDIRSPHLDSVLSARSRVFGVTMAWHEWTQSFLTPDESYCLRNQPIRRFYMHMASMRADAQILAIASSQVHPSVLIGTADGFVLASNPIRRVLDMKAEPWQQVWFRHEWRRGMNVKEAPQQDVSGAQEGISPAAPVSQPAEPNTFNTPEPKTPMPPVATNPAARPPISALREPLSRITDSYKLETAQLQRPQGPNVQEGTRFATIYEEGTAVTQLAWNPNLRFGGWAAAGLGCGLVRVEDVAI